MELGSDCVANSYKMSLKLKTNFFGLHNSVQTQFGGTVCFSCVEALQGPRTSSITQCARDDFSAWRPASIPDAASDCMRRQLLYTIPSTVDNSNACTQYHAGIV